METNFTFDDIVNFLATLDTDFGDQPFDVDVADYNHACQHGYDASQRFDIKNRKEALWPAQRSSV